jgi:hypothetical protein
MLTAQEKEELFQTIQSNSHEVYLVSVEEMNRVVQSWPGGNTSRVKAGWKKVREAMNIGAGYYSSADTAVLVARVVGDMGAVGARVYIREYGGRAHIILRGSPGLRRIFTGTKYGVNNARVISMGLGTAGAVSVARQGGILTIILLSAYRVVDYFLTDSATLTQLIGTLATDVVKVGIATGASLGALALATAFTGVATFAIGPLIVVLAAGFLTSLALDAVDKRTGITNRVIAALDELSERAENSIDRTKDRVIAAAAQAAGQVIDYAVESVQRVAIRWVRGTLKEYLSPYRGL